MSISRFMSKISWSPIPQDEKDCESPQPAKTWLPHLRLPRFPWEACIAIGATSIFWLIIILIIYGSPNLFNIVHEVNGVPTVLHCGNTTERARELGCVYDILLIHWIPQPCVDQAALDKYKAFGSWQAYGDAEGLEPLSIEAMSERSMYWTSVRDHARHCSVMWEKQYRGFMSGNMDSLGLSKSHTEHCAKTLLVVSGMEPSSLDTRLTSVSGGFAKCTIGKKYR